MNQRNNKDNNQFSSGKGLSLYISICAAKGLQEIMKNNLGPNGTMKILVSTSGEIKISKDGSYLLKEMQIQNPTASLIAKTVITQKSYIGDGATSTIILIGEALRNIEKYLEKGVHVSLTPMVEQLVPSVWVVVLEWRTKQRVNRRRGQLRLGRMGHQECAPSLSGRSSL